ISVLTHARLRRRFRRNCSQCSNSSAPAMSSPYRSCKTPLPGWPHSKRYSLVCVSWTSFARKDHRRTSMSKIVPIPRKPALGLCARRLEALDTFLAREVACGRIPGAVFRLALEGREIHCAAHGLQDPLKRIPMRTESLFRTECMTKYATVLAVLRACERGLLSLLDPV